MGEGGRNINQMKERKNLQKKEQNKKEASNLSDTKFKVTVIRILKQLSENYKELRGNYNSMKKDIETMDKNQLERRIPYLTSRLHWKELKVGWMKQRIELAIWNIR